MKAGPKAQESPWEGRGEEDIKKGDKEEEYRAIIPLEMPVALC